MSLACSTQLSTTILHLKATRDFAFDTITCLFGDVPQIELVKLGRIRKDMSLEVTRGSNDARSSSRECGRVLLVYASLVHALSFRTVCHRDAFARYRSTPVLFRYRVMSLGSSVSSAVGWRPSFFVLGVLVLPLSVNPVKFRHFSIYTGNGFIAVPLGIRRTRDPRKICEGFLSDSCILKRNRV